MKLKRIFQNEEGASPGGGAPQTPAPAQVPTQGASPAPAFTADQLKGMIAETFGELKNGLFADLRKAGALKQEKAPTDPPTPAVQAPGATAPTQGLSAADVQAMIAKEGVVMALAGKNGLSSAQVGHMKAALSNVAADQLETAAGTWLTEMGLVKVQTAQPATAPATSAPVPPPPAAPSAPSGHTLPMLNGVLNVFSLTEQQIKEVGPAGIRSALETLQKAGQQAAGIPQRPKPPNQR